MSSSSSFFLNEFPYSLFSYILFLRRLKTFTFSSPTFSPFYTLLASFFIFISASFILTSHLLSYTFCPYFLSLSLSSFFSSLFIYSILLQPTTFLYFFSFYFFLFFNFLLPYCFCFSTYYLWISINMSILVYSRNYFLLFLFLFQSLSFLPFSFSCAPLYFHTRNTI